MLEKCRDPLFCFTSDLDWVPESMIDEMVGFFNDENIPLTPFVTHASEIIKKNYQGDKSKYVGLHPNFVFDTTHGKDIDEIISNNIKLWSDARCFRSHYYVDSLFITQKFYNAGFKYDSNACLFLQPDIIPQSLVSGLLRFPVFFEDIIYADKVGVFDLSYLSQKLMTPGLKIFNIHPIHFCINTPSIEYYKNNRAELYSQKDWHPHIYDGNGLRIILEELIYFIKNNNYNAFYLEDLYSMFKPPHEDKGMSPFFIEKTMMEKPITNVSVWKDEGVLNEYSKSDVKEKSEMVKAVYDKMDGKNLYVTSPDFNLREIEIKFIIDTVKKLYPRDEQLKIIDIGCGNGLTDLRLAQSISADIIGTDFSKAMIEGAEYLRNKFEDMDIIPIFKIGDARKIEYPDNYFDVVISQRLIMNLPDEETQKAVIAEARRVLKKNGLFIMVEGTRNGLRRLNDFREKMGLDAILDKSETNVSSLKFEEEEIEPFLKKYFKIINKQHFGMYYFISRVIHPLLVSPGQPRYDAKINEIARKIAELEPDYKQMGHILGYILEAI